MFFRSQLSQMSDVSVNRSKKFMEPDTSVYISSWAVTLPCHALQVKCTLLYLFSRPYFSALTSVLCVPPACDVAHGSTVELEVGIGQTHGLDVGCPGERRAQLYECHVSALLRGRVPLCHHHPLDFSRHLKLVSAAELITTHVEAVRGHIWWAKGENSGVGW